MRESQRREANPIGSMAAAEATCLATQEKTKTTLEPWVPLVLICFHFSCFLTSLHFPFPLPSLCPCFAKPLPPLFHYIKFNPSISLHIVLLHCSAFIFLLFSRKKPDRTASLKQSDGNFSTISLFLLLLIFFFLMRRCWAQCPTRSTRRTREEIRVQEVKEIPETELW